MDPVIEEQEEKKLQGNETIYMSESDRMNETMSFAIMVNVLHALGFVRMNYPQMLVSLRDEAGKRN